MPLGMSVARTEDGTEVLWAELDALIAVLLFRTVRLQSRPQRPRGTALQRPAASPQCPGQSSRDSTPSSRRRNPSHLARGAHAAHLVGAGAGSWDGAAVAQRAESFELNEAARSMKVPQHHGH
jgi:hypothetical protein